jgi:hypothetical protein
LTATKALQITIAAPPPGNPIISTASPLPNATATVAYSQSLAATVGTPPYTWVATSNTCPFTLSSAGAITGTPSTSGACSVTAQVTDAASQTASRAFAITVDAAPPPPPVIGPGTIHGRFTGIIH